MAICILLACNPCTRSCEPPNASHTISQPLEGRVPDSADISDRSPRKLLIFIINKNLVGLKNPKNHFIKLKNNPHCCAGVPRLLWATTPRCESWCKNTTVTVKERWNCSLQSWNGRAADSLLLDGGTLRQAASSVYATSSYLTVYTASTCSSRFPRLCFETTFRRRSSGLSSSSSNIDIIPRSKAYEDRCCWLQN